MSFDPFAAPLLKIERAKHHITDLNGKINSYLAERPFRLMMRQYPYLSELQLFVETRKPIPQEFSLLIGDAVHNLRASLDIMIFGLVGDKVSRPDMLYFPFPKRKDAFDGAVTGGQVHLAGPKVVAAIKGLEPYPNGKYGLYGLHELDVRDKHRLILPAWKTVEIKQSELKKIHELFDFGRDPDSTFNFQMDPDKPVLAAVQFQPTGLSKDVPPYEAEASIQPLFRICLDKWHESGRRHDFASWPVIDALLTLVSSCETAIRDIRAAI